MSAWKRIVFGKRVFADIPSELVTPGYFRLNQRRVNDILCSSRDIFVLILTDYWKFKDSVMACHSDEVSVFEAL